MGYSLLRPKNLGVAGRADDLLDGGLAALLAAAAHDDQGATLGKIPSSLDVCLGQSSTQCGYM